MPFAFLLMCCVKIDVMIMCLLVGLLCSAKDRIVIKVLRQTKGYSVSMFMKKIPEIQWSRSALNRILKHIDAT